MAPIRNARAIFAEVPVDYVKPGKHVVYDESQTIDLDNVALEGGFLVKTLVLSADPVLRIQMRDASQKSFVPAFKIGEPLFGWGVGVIVRSEHAAFRPGDHVSNNYGTLKHQEYAVYKDPNYFDILQDIGLPWANYVGVLGLAGQTAYVGWKEYAGSKKGETAFITTAAGSVGSLVIQLAKQDGLKVIASSGSDEKVAFARECGADVSFNYKKEDANDVLEREGGIDVYFDNVGGRQLEAAFEHSHVGARFIMCGAASTYNDPNPYAPKNTARIFHHELKVYGFLHASLIRKYLDEFYATVPPLVKEGQIKFKEDIVRGLDKIGQALLDLGTGANSGKVAVIVADD